MVEQAAVNRRVGGSKPSSGARARRRERLAIRRWLDGQRAAAELQFALQAAEGPRPARAVAHLLSALSALESMGRWPGPRDPVSEHAVQEVRRRWARIQQHARRARH